MGNSESDFAEKKGLDKWNLQMDKNIAEVNNAYNKDAETYDDIGSEAFYANQYELWHVS